MLIENFTVTKNVDVKGYQNYIIVIFFVRIKSKILDTIENYLLN